MGDESCWHYRADVQCPGCRWTFKHTNTHGAVVVENVKTKTKTHQQTPLPGKGGPSKYGLGNEDPVNEDPGKGNPGIEYIGK